MNFLKVFFASCLGSMLGLVAICILFFIGLMIMISASEEEVLVKQGSVLHIKVDGLFNELQEDNPLADLSLPGSVESNTGLIDLIRVIEQAATDSRITGILLEVERPATYYSTLREIRRSLQAFRDSGKWVIAHNEYYSEGGYYLASVSDEVYMNPHGALTFNGLSAGFTSFKKLLDKLEIRPQIFRVGEFKSAVEPFMLEKMSPENRVQLTELINSIHESLLTQVAGSRDIPMEELKQIADQMRVRSAEDAVTYKLIDDLIYRDQLDSVVEARAGKKPEYITYKKYHKSLSAGSTSKNEIAVVVAEGTIMQGRSGQSHDMIGSDTFVEELRKARTNDNVKAIVLRVNSPGGEPQASDMIWREIQLARQVKPVIASMGDYAASGGYYIAMGCDTIVANPTTITGSIGIFGILFDLSEFMSDKIGITFDEVNTGKFGELYTVTRPLTEEEQTIIQNELDRFYKTFVNLAAEGRDLSPEEVLKIAAGRVWSGDQALEHGLVDMLGGLNEAIKIAATKAGVEADYKVRYYPRQLPFPQNILAELDGQSEVRSMKQALGDDYKLYKRYQEVKKYQGAQARMPFEFVME